MSLFICECCGTIDNTATSYQKHTRTRLFDWQYLEELKGLQLCYSCGPITWSDGKAIGKQLSKLSGPYPVLWHDRFHKEYLDRTRFQNNNDIMNTIVGIGLPLDYREHIQKEGPFVYRVTLEDTTVVEVDSQLIPRYTMLAIASEGKLYQDQKVLSVGLYL